MPVHRIFVVDDDPDVRAVLVASLRTRFEVVEASDGLEALDKLEAYEPDFAVIDAVMPVMDGFQLCETIRKHEKFRAIPVLFLSAHNSPENIKKGYASGANLFMTKPVDPLRVLKNIDFTIDHEKPPIRSKRHSVDELKRIHDEERSRKRQPPAPRMEHPAEMKPSVDDGEIIIGEISESEELEILEAPRVEPQPEVGNRGAVGDEKRPRAATKPRVMVVENEDDPRRIIELALGDLYEVTNAKDGVEAIERIVKFQPDLLLLDIMMPRMNGYQLLQTIRRNRVYGHLPVIVVSGKATRRDQDYAYKLGATDFLAKPFDPDELLAKLDSLTSAADFVVQPKRVSMKEINEELKAEQKKAQTAAVDSNPDFREMQALIQEDARRRRETRTK